jgi:hypothetical protein
MNILDLDPANAFLLMVAISLTVGERTMTFLESMMSFKKNK